MIELMKVRLDLFDGAAAGNGGDGSATSAAPTESSMTESTGESNPVTTRRGKGELSNVVYGKQEGNAADSEPETIVSSSTLDEKRRRYKELTQGEFKDIHTEEFQKIFDRRHKDYKELQSRMESQKPIMDMLLGRYGIKDGDISKLQAAIEDDDSYWEAAADEAGMSIEQYKNFEKLRRQNEELMRGEQERQRDARARQQAEQWFSEGEKLKGIFPDFDLSTELQNPRFVSMLKSGVSVEDSYKAMHFDDIMSGAIRSASAEAEKRVADNIRARGARPQENATLSRSAFTVRDDVSKLTKADRREIVRRASRGETIRF